MTYVNPRLRSLTAVVLAIVFLLAACGSDAAEDAATALATDSPTATAEPAAGEDTDGGGAPDFFDAAAALGVTTAELEAALPAPPG